MGLVFQFHAENVIPAGDWIWVFGSNLAGRYGKGQAKVARTTFRAVLGVASGPTGQAYAIPVLNHLLQALAPDVVAGGVATFLDYARAHHELNFFVTALGVGTASGGYSASQIAPLFAAAPPNCSLPITWRTLLAPGASTASAPPTLQATPGAPVLPAPL